jgi:hypothetical protein
MLATPLARDSFSVGLEPLAHAQVGEHSVTPCLLNGARNTASNGELPGQRTETLGIVRLTSGFCRQ